MLSSTHACIKSGTGRGVELFPGIIESEGVNAGWYRQTCTILHPVLTSIGSGEYAVLRIARIDILQIVGVHSKGADILILQRTCLPRAPGKNAYSGATSRKQDQQRQQEQQTTITNSFHEPGHGCFPISSFSPRDELPGSYIQRSHVPHSPWAASRLCCPAASRFRAGCQQSTMATIL